jgi:ABC-type Co2+ transport system permease subunit
MSGPGLNLPKDDPRYYALSVVRAPAFLLLCVGTLNLVLCVMVLAFAGLTASGAMTLSPEWAAALKEYSLVSFLLPAAAAIICGVLSVWGAISALNLRGWGLAMVGAITASFCLSPTVCVGIPATSWMLFILSRPEVRKAFTQ